MQRQLTLTNLCAKKRTSLCLHKVHAQNIVPHQYYINNKQQNKVKYMFTTQKNACLNLFGNMVFKNHVVSTTSYV